MLKFNLLSLSFIFSLFFCVTIEKNVYAQEENSITSEAFYFESIRKNQDKEELDAFLSTLDENYAYFTPAGQNVKVRTGPGVKYQAYKKTLSKNVKWRGYDYGETWFAGIVSTKQIAGDNMCSTWQEVMLIEFFWESWSTFTRPRAQDILDGSNEMKPAYICKDFITTHKLDEKQRKEFKRVFFQY